MGTGNDAAGQLSNIDAGVQQGYNLKQTAVSALVGGVIGGVAPVAYIGLQKLSNSISQTRIGGYLTRESQSGFGLRGILADNTGAVGTANNTRAKVNFIGNPDGTVVSTPKTDFYVGPDGTTVPAIGYRYMNSIYASETKENMSAPTLSYFGFEKIDSASAAAARYQVLRPDWSDTRLRGTFDTLQLFSSNGKINARVPMANGGRANFKEPFANYYPKKTHGSGGGQQLVPINDKGVYFNEVTLLREK